MLLPKDCRIKNLIASWCHDQVAHPGRAITINLVRLNIIVRSIISKCARCKHVRRRFQQQEIADLPRDMMGEEAPLNFAALICFGPLW